MSITQLDRFSIIAGSGVNEANRERASFPKAADSLSRDAALELCDKGS